jgi:hypothetical protein
VCAKKLIQNRISTRKLQFSENNKKRKNLDMNFFRHILLVQVFFSTLNVYCSSCDLKSSLDNISACGYFESLMLVNAGTGFTVSEGTCGIEIDKTVYVDQPYVFFPNANEDKQYTLVMVDNDDPYTEDGKDFLQWLVINIDGTSLKHGVGAFYGEAAAGKKQKSLPTKL